MNQHRFRIGRKLLHLFLSIILAAAVAVPNGLTVSAVSGECGGNTTWDFTNGVLTIGGSGAVTIEGWALFKGQVNSVVIGDGITGLPSALFINNSTLTSIKIGKSVSTIPNSFCMNCSGLSNIQFSDGLQKIDKSAFQNCSSLRTLSFPSTLKEIGEKAFFACLSLNALTLPDSLTTIGAEAFEGNNVKSLKLGKNLKTIGNMAFQYSCFSEVEIPDSVTQIGTDAFGIVYNSINRSGNSIGHSYTGTKRMVTIIGKEGGAAQQFANAGGFPFKTPGSASHTHTWSDWSVKVKAGCERTGEQIRTCSGCGESESKTIPATGHSWSEWKTETAASCGKEGKSVRTCAYCNEIESQVIPAKEHNWSEWKTEIAASCEKDGKSVRTCANCNETESQVIPATGHDWGEWKTETAASCETDGKRIRTCANCEETESQVISATGHSWTEWQITKQPTVDGAGEQESFCEVCGRKRTASVAALVGYQVSVSVSEGGSVTPSGETKIAEGGRLTLKITADQGWQLASVYVNGSEMRPDSTGELMLNDIRSNQNISVVFQKKEQPKTRKCNFIDITPKRLVWLADETGLSMQDFMISANISEKGMVSWLDVTADCVPDMTGMADSAQYGTGNVRFRYTGNDEAVKEYVQQNNIVGQIPLYLRGDGDGNGTVDVVDAEIALTSYVVHLSESSNDGLSEIQRTVLDVDGNGETALEDAVYILQYYIMEFVGLTPDWKSIIN